MLFDSSSSSTSMPAIRVESSSFFDPAFFARPEGHGGRSNKRNPSAMHNVVRRHERIIHFL